MYFGRSYMTVIKAGANIPSIYKKISYFVKSQLPSVFIDIESLIVPFLEAYYEWMEGDGGITYDIKRLLEIQDIDKTTESFILFILTWTQLNLSSIVWLFTQFSRNSF